MLAREPGTDTPATTGLTAIPFKQTLSFRIDLDVENLVVKKGLGYV